MISRKGHSWYGVGTFEAPRVKFYFKRPGEVQKPNFHLTAEGAVVCNTCGKSLGTGQEVVRHWQDEFKKGCGPRIGDMQVSEFEVVQPTRNMVEINEDNDLCRRGSGIQSSLLEDSEIVESINALENVEVKFDERVDLKVESKAELEDSENLSDIKCEVETTSVIYISCDKCDFRGSKLSLKRHKQTVHSGIRYPCNKCDHKSTTKPSLRRHKQIHLKDDDELDPAEKIVAMAKYEEMKRIGRERTRMRRLQSPKIAVDCSLPCEVCGKSVKNPAQMKVHLLRAHSDVREFKCDHCDYAAKFRWCLREHVIRAHSETKNFSCDLCDCSYTSKKSLHLHVKAKHDPQTYLCDKCDFKSAVKGTVYIHKKTVHKEGDAYMCEQCDYVTYSKQSFEIHTNVTHLGLKQCCDKCDYKANTKQQLQLHVDAVHLGVRYQCDQCEYSSTNKQVLKSHTNAKHGGTRYSCSICPFSASFETNLRKHMKTNHTPKINEELE